MLWFFTSGSNTLRCLIIHSFSDICPAFFICICVLRNAYATIKLYKPRICMKNFFLTLDIFELHYFSIVPYTEKKRGSRLSLALTFLLPWNWRKASKNFLFIRLYYHQSFSLVIDFVSNVLLTVSIRWASV